MNASGYRLVDWALLCVCDSSSFDVLLPVVASEQTVNMASADAWCVSLARQFETSESVSLIVSWMCDLLLTTTTDADATTANASTATTTARALAASTVAWVRS